LTADFEPLFRCWNSGNPKGKTFDPQYVPNGLSRMKITRHCRDQRLRDRSDGCGAFYLAL